MASPRYSWGVPDDALKDLNSPMVGNQNDAPLWRALASAKQGKWPEAREGLRKSEAAIAALPIELQREIFMEAIRASIEVRDFSAAETQLERTRGSWIESELRASRFLSDEYTKGLGRTSMRWRPIGPRPIRKIAPFAAQGRMREIALRYRLGDLKRAEVVAALETLTAIWRGDETEAEALQLLAQLYIEDGRYRDAFNLMRIALAGASGFRSHAPHSG